jgi:ribosome maturation factor RimP
MIEATTEYIERLVLPILLKQQVVLCGIKVGGRVSRPLIQVFVDWEERPITIEACTKITRELLDVFDMEERFPPDYRLEVSSPGIDAPLSEAWQFRRNIGRTIGIDRGGSRFEATILDVTAGQIVRLEDDDGICERPLDELRGAKVILFPTTKKPPKRKRNEARDS